MSRTAKVVAGGVLVAMFSVATPVLADPPGPGDKQCIPGAHGMPKPGGKTGTCPPR
jgi:hypothetical protein